MGASCSFATEKKCTNKTPLLPPPQDLRNPLSTKRIIYIDSDIYWADPRVSVRDAVDAGYNVILFAFYLKQGAWDMARVWQDFPETDKDALLQYANSRGAILGVSLGGATEVFYLDDPVNLATQVCNWTLTNKLQILDADFENIAPGFTYPGCADLYTWMNSFFQTARNVLGPNLYISAAPQTPYLSVPGKSGTWPGIRGGFTEVLKQNPSIDWYFLQMYNQGPTNYVTYDLCFVDSGINFPFSAISQLNENGAGIPYEKMVFGTFLQARDGQGNNNPYDIHDYLQRAAIQFNYHAGAGIWQYAVAGSPSPLQWIQIVFGSPYTYFQPLMTQASCQTETKKTFFQERQTKPRARQSSQKRKNV